MTQSLFSVQDKVVVVTGGSRGIGEMIAEGFVDAGARVYLTARKVEALEATAGRLAAKGHCVAVPSDLSTAEGIEAFTAAVLERESQVDVLVNNAGATWGAPLEEFPDSAFDKLWAINVKAVFRLTVTLLPALRKSATADDPARVINIGSIDGIAVPATDNYAYAASKSAVHMMTRQLAHRLAKENITVNAIAPGAFESKMTAWLLDDAGAKAAIEEGTPLGRIGRPEDMAGTAIYLASRAGSYLTGAVIPVDGGISTHG